ncbi:hypothetical protein N9H19_00860 [Flavobacteriales bacterium]|nr:hypothetical protein [Flavobacteriales bacterium]
MALDVLASFKELANDQRKVSDISELIKSGVFTKDISDFFTVVPNIKARKQVAAVGNMEYLVKKGGSGCNPTFGSKLPPALSQEWDPREVGVNLKMCYKDFETYFTQWALAGGNNISDLSGTDVATYITSIVQDAMRKDILRIALLGDEDVLNPGGDQLLTDVAMDENYDQIGKGLIATLEYFKTIPALADNFVELDKNAGNTQYTLTSDYAYNLFDEVAEVDNFEGDIFLTNQKLFKNYKNFFKNQLLESSKGEIQNGLQQLSIDGSLITPIKQYDRWRQKDFKVSDHIHLPHFILNTRKEFLQIGVDDLNALSDLKLEYTGGADENIYIKAKFKMDFKMTNPYDFKAAI